MTLPIERTNAVLAAEDFLVDLLSSSKTPRVPHAIRVRAFQLLRHYPSLTDINQAARKAPDIFAIGKENEFR